MNKMKRFVFLAAAAVALILAVSSCEQEEMARHYIKFEESNANFRSNLYLQRKAMNLIQYDANHLDNSFYGTERDAISWFNETLDYLGSEEFASADPEVIVMENTSATFSLMSYSSESSVDGINYGHEVTRRTVEFKEHSML